MNHRLEQIESTLRRVVAEVLQRSISDPRIEGLVSVTRVSVSDDLANATIYVSVLPTEKQRTTVKGLQHAAVHIQALARKKLALRRVPRFAFRGDEELKKQAQTLRAIREAAERSGFEADADADADAEHRAPATPASADPTRGSASSTDPTPTPTPTPTTPHDDRPVEPAPPRSGDGTKEHR
jgi:ribosome-binding factor A